MAWARRDQVHAHLVSHSTCSDTHILPICALVCHAPSSTPVSTLPLAAPHGFSTPQTMLSPLSMSHPHPCHAPHPCCPPHLCHPPCLYCPCPTQPQTNAFGQFRAFGGTGESGSNSESHSIFLIVSQALAYLHRTPTSNHCCSHSLQANPMFGNLSSSTLTPGGSFGASRSSTCTTSHILPMPLSMPDCMLTLAATA